MRISTAVALVTCLLLLAASLAFFAPGTAAGSPATAGRTFIVDSDLDLGDAVPGDGICRTAAGQKCTLRAAIDELNAGTGGDSIILPAVTIRLGQMLTVTRSVAIRGAGAAASIIDGNASVRAFYFVPRSGSHLLSGLTIRNTRVSKATDPVTEYLRSGYGGAILNEADVTLSNVNLTGNVAEQGGAIYSMHDFIGGDGRLIVPALTMDYVTAANNTATSDILGQGGGAIFSGGAMTATHVTLQGNTARQGGGIYVNNPHNLGVPYPVTMSDFVISGNTAKYGGGVNIDLGHAAMRRGLISNNVVTCCDDTGQPYTGGGGLYHNQGALEINGVTFSGNSSTATGGYGGGIYNAEIMTLTNSTITGNRAASGAGIMNGTYPPDGQRANSLTVINSTISGNVGVGHYPPVDSIGGGILNMYLARLTLIQTTVTGNSAVAGGGIEFATNVQAESFVRLANSLVAGNSASDGPDCRGSVGSLGYNLLGNLSRCGFGPGAGDLVNMDARLGPLAPNGGTTLSHVPLLGSPAIDHGGAAYCQSLDQKGVARPADGDGDGRAACDIGAAEAPGALHFPMTFNQ